MPTLEGWLAFVRGSINETRKDSNLCNFYLEHRQPGVSWYPDGVTADGIEYEGSTSWSIRGYLKYQSGGCSGQLDEANAGAVSVVRTRTVCSLAEGYRYFTPAGQCRHGRYEPRPDADAGNVGPQCPDCDAGQPITPATGNMWHVITDYQAPKSASDLTLNRIYNSSPIYADPTTIRGFGVRWTHSFNKSLRAELKDIDPKSGQCWRFDSGELECVSGFPSVEKIPSAVSIALPDGKQILFSKSGVGSYTSKANVNEQLVAIMATDDVAVQEWILTSGKNDRIERFSRTGSLLSTTERNGLQQVMTYSDGVSNDTATSRFPINAPACASAHPGVLLPAGRLLCVTNHWGRQLQFRYDNKGRISEMIDPANQSYLYEYDGLSGGCVPGNEKTLACKANNLTKVTYPDGKSQTYFYNEDSKINGGGTCTNLKEKIGNGFGPTPFINLMTGLVDENEERYITWTYDCSGRATSSQVGESMDKVTLAYPATGNATATVTHQVGAQEKPQASVRTYNNTYVLGIAKTTAIDGPCVECGTIAERAYDSIGNVTKTKDFNNNYSCFAYENARYLETARVEGVANADCFPLLTAQTLALPVRKTTTKWHAQFRLREAIAEPKRITKYKYDAAGNLISKSEQATTDLTGAQGLSAPVTGSIRTWTYTYSNIGQLKTVTGPRTDIVDRTTYDYDPTTGELIKVTNAANQATTFSDYDAHGHVRTIRAPNGVTTTLSYTPRGLVASQAISNGTSTQTTSYDYTPSGQVKTVTLPDNSVTTYAYDIAQRLTSISNNRGESIIYTLDLTGNRIKEEVRDPNGNLARQITRTYDITGRLTSQTGAAQ
nr:DUF6531 domain-containing protein [Massilia sp. CCM 8734]